jgi:hypothetical protein
MVTGRNVVTLEQALAFKLYGKQLRHMRSDDWRQWLKRVRAEYQMLEEIDERNITDAQDQRFHASADRFDDLMTALGIICAERMEVGDAEQALGPLLSALRWRAAWNWS